MKKNLNYQCFAENQQNYVYVCASGKATPSCIIDMYDNVTQYANTLNINKLLISFTELELCYSGSEVLRVMKKIAPLLSQFTIARIVALDCYKNDLIEAISTQKSLPVKNFENEAAAIDWLVTQ
ncbi:hypothetical protein [Thalassotalea ganghwensis]